MPFLHPWTDLPSPQLERGAFQHHLLQVAAWDAEKWNFNPVVVHEGRVVGMQDIHGEHFGVTRSFRTGSWLGREFQGRGLGTEMRAAILHFGFAGLRAEEARSEVLAGNEASLGVSRALGYQEDGASTQAIRGRRSTEIRLLLTRERWQTSGHTGFEIEGLEGCEPLFGLKQGAD